MELADLKMNLLIEDKQLNKVTEHYTHEDVKIENVMQRIKKYDASDKNLIQTAGHMSRPLRFLSIDISKPKDAV